MHHQPVCRLQTVNIFTDFVTAVMIVKNSSARMLKNSVHGPKFTVISVNLNASVIYNAPVVMPPKIILTFANLILTIQTSQSVLFYRFCYKCVYV